MLKKWIITACRQTSFQSVLISYGKLRQYFPVCFFQGDLFFMIALFNKFLF